MKEVFKKMRQRSILLKTKKDKSLISLLNEKGDSVKIKNF